jgi:hypothetical protein
LSYVAFFRPSHVAAHRTARVLDIEGSAERLLVSVAATEADHRLEYRASAVRFGEEPIECGADRLRSLEELIGLASWRALFVHGQIIVDRRRGAMCNYY